MPRYAFLNGEIVPWDDARVHVASVGFRFGTGVFEGIRAYWNPEQEQLYVYQLAEHLNRLIYSQRFMRFDSIFQPDYVADRLLALLRANEFRETLHIMATSYVSGPGLPQTCGPVDLAITAAPSKRPAERTNGCRVQVSAWQRVPDAAMPMRVKCNANYQNGRLASVQALADGYDTALMLNSRGKVAEGPGMCFFMFRDGQAVTPGVNSDILESITRRTVIQLLTEHLGVPVVERDIDRSELVAADEAFFCGTAWEVTPIAQIDRLPVGEGVPGPQVTALQRLFLDIAEGRSELYPEWRTPVYTG
jgi:branched-chain amino acid aminotransferase